MKLIRLLPIIIACITLASCAKKDLVLSKDSTDIQKESYALGKMIGKQISNDFTQIEYPLFDLGFQHGMNHEAGFLNDKEVMAILVAARTRIQDQAKKESKVARESNIKDEKAFLAKNAKKKGVITTKNGLQYKILKKGKEKAKVTAKDEITVHYKGSLLDGTVFDSSYDRKQPATFSLSGLIVGWQEALELMPLGAKWKLFIPASLAYGDRSVGKIGPNSMLIFEIELIDINGQLAKEKKDKKPAKEKRKKTSTKKKK
jgi:FKBP-type peptidyl-prolyl cis-trans isomerase